MQYLVDTVAMVRHFTGIGRIGNVASRIFDTIEDSEDSLVISIISLVEIMYLAEKNRIEISLSVTLDRIESSSKYYIADLSPDILRVAETIQFYELHDRLILATAKWLEIKVISSDKNFKQVGGIDTIWD